MSDRIVIIYNDIWHIFITRQCYILCYIAKAFKAFKQNEFVAMSCPRSSWRLWSNVNPVYVRDNVRQYSMLSDVYPQHRSIPDLLTTA